MTELFLLMIAFLCGSLAGVAIAPGLSLIIVIASFLGCCYIATHSQAIEEIKEGLKDWRKML